jgi:hypothetical protein
MWTLVPGNGEERQVIFWRSGQGPRFMGCGAMLFAGLVISLLVYAISGGQCVVFVGP